MVMTLRVGSPRAEPSRPAVGAARARAARRRAAHPEPRRAAWRGPPLAEPVVLAERVPRELAEPVVPAEPVALAEPVVLAELVAQAE